MVRKQHSFVRGARSVEGKEWKYEAADGELQKWVAATLFLGVCKARETFYWSGVDWNWLLPLWVRGRRKTGGEEQEEEERVRRKREERWQLCQAHGEYAIALDMPSEMWPTSVEGFEVYVEETMREKLVVTEEARKLARILLWDVRVPWWMGWVLPVARVFMACWLPSSLREGYGLPNPEEWWVSWCYHVFIWLIGLVNLMTPRMVNNVAFGLMRKDMERAVEGIQRTGRWTI